MAKKEQQEATVGNQAVVGDPQVKASDQPYVSVDRDAQSLSPEHLEILRLQQVAYDLIKTNTAMRMILMDNGMSPSTIDSTVQMLLNRIA